MKQSNNRSSLLLGALLISLISFAAGTRYESIYASIGSMLGLRVATGSIDLSSAQETYRHLKANFDGDLDQQALINGANRGLVAAAGDPYTTFLDPSEVKDFERSMSGDIGGGIGAEIGLRNNKPTVIRPLKGSPAEQAGLQVGDIILEVNGQSVDGWTVDRVVDKIRGDIGSKVSMAILRGGETKKFSITRQKIVSPTVEHQIKDGVGILTVYRFNDETGKLSRSAAEEFVAKGVERVVLDMRGNPGGTVTAAQQLSGLWLDKQVIMTERRGSETVKTIKSTGSPILSDMPTVVLINGGSASASEIVAGALSEYGKAKLVGETSFGKGSVQVLLNLSTGAQMKVTQSRWFTPHGKTIDHQGIKPDIEVKLTAEDVNNNRDPQLEKALSL